MLAQNKNKTKVFSSSLFKFATFKKHLTTIYKLRLEHLAFFNFRFLNKKKTTVETRHIFFHKCNLIYLRVNSSKFNCLFHLLRFLQSFLLHRTILFTEILVYKKINQT